MELALIIGAFALITALIALCTFWFFNLHRRYLVLDDQDSAKRTAEDDYSFLEPSTAQGEVSGGDRGKKPFFANSNQERPSLCSMTKDQWLSRKIRTATANREPERTGDEEKVWSVEVGEGPVESPSGTEKGQIGMEETKEIKQEIMKVKKKAR